MALSIEQKQKLVEEVSSEAKVALSAAAAEYRGLSVDQLTKLRSNAKDLNVYLKVVKNTLAKRAIKDTDFECMQNDLKGPLILAFSRDNPGSAAKLFNDFAKDFISCSLNVHGPECRFFGINHISYAYLANGGMIPIK